MFSECDTPYDPSLERWSPDSLESLQNNLFSETPTHFDVEPIRDIAIVGALISNDGYLTQRDSDYIKILYEQIKLSGLPVSKHVRVVNYNFAQGTDIFKRSEPADVLLLCNINKAKHDRDLYAPIFDETANYSPEERESFYFHISPKSKDIDAWKKLAQRLRSRVIAVFGCGRSVHISAFNKPQDRDSLGFPSLVNNNETFGPPRSNFLQNNKSQKPPFVEWAYVQGRVPPSSEGSGRLQFGVTTRLLDQMIYNNIDTLFSEKNLCLSEIIERHLCQQQGIAYTNNGSARRPQSCVRDNCRVRYG